MTHSEAAASKYYQAAGKTTRSIESFKKIQLLQIVSKNREMD